MYPEASFSLLFHRKGIQSPLLDTRAERVPRTPTVWFVVGLSEAAEEGGPFGGVEPRPSFAEVSDCEGA